MQDFVNIVGGTPQSVRKVRSVGHRTSLLPRSVRCQQSRVLRIGLDVHTPKVRYAIAFRRFLEQRRCQRVTRGIFRQRYDGRLQRWFLAIACSVHSS